VKNYSDAIGGVPAKYKAGVSRTQNWQEKAIAGESLYGQKVSEAVANQSRAKGLAKVSNEQWKSKAAGKGATRIGQGMTESLPKFQSGIAPVLDVIRNTSIGARTADPMANVDNRVKPLVKALHDYKRSK